MNRAVMGALLSHWRARPAQLAMLVVGLALATALWSGVQAINAEARASYARAAEMLGADELDRLVPADGGRVAQEVFARLDAAGWRVSPVLEGRIAVAGEEMRLLGVDAVSAPDRAGFDALPSGGAAMMLAMAPPEILFAAPDTLDRLGPRATGPEGAELRAAEGLAPGVVVADLRYAQRLIGARGLVSYLVLHPDQPETRAPLDEVASALRLRRASGSADLARLTESFHLNLTAFGLLSFVVGLFIVRSAVGLAFEQRRGVFRTLRALGVPLARLLWLLLAELALLALVAGLAGVGLGYVMAALLLPDVAATLSGLYGAEVSGTLALRPSWGLSGLAIALAGTLIAAAQGLWRVGRMPVLAAAQPRAWGLASARELVIQAGAALALALAALGLARWGESSVSGLALLAAILLSAALALPVVLSGLLAGAARLARGAVAEWFWADTRQQLPGLSLALMALLLALAANIGVGTMVQSFRATFTGWLDQRLAAELYVTARDAEEARALRGWLDGREDVRAVLPIRWVEAELAGAPGRIYGVADHATYRENWPLLRAQEGAWDRVAAGEAVLINEQLFRRDGLGVGDRLALPAGEDLPVAGIYSDYGNPQGQAMMGLEAFDGRFPGAPRLQHALRVAPGRSDALSSALQDSFGLPPEAITDQAEAKATSLRIFEQTFAVTGALNALTLGVAGVALLAALATLSEMRLAQLAPVWALGLTRARLARLEVARTVMLAALTFVAALPVGLILAWALLAIVNVAAFGWRLPMQVFPADWARLGTLALAVAAAAAAGPARRLARIAPAGLLRVFASER
ncbi:ABC transporter permease [Rhodobacteraceae bacterium WD3A24]|nr:ABC transporter permease [Rhodobacteraceae bacterium WD3A24]